MLQSLTALLVKAEQLAEGKPLLSDSQNSMTGRQLLQHVAFYVQFLEKSNIQKNDRVVVQLNKSCEQVAFYFALWHRGAIQVPVHISLKQQQLAHIIKDSQATAVFVDAIRLTQYHHEFVQMDSVKLCALPLPAIDTACPELNEHTPLQLTDIATILYTSGSTGLAKGVVLTQQNLLLGAQSVATYLELDGSDRVLALLPFSFDYGLNQLLSAWYVGAHVVLHDFLLVPFVIQQIAKHQITVLAAVPPLWQSLAAGSWPEEATSYLRIWTNSGGAMPGCLLANLQALFPNAKPYLMYGLTEAFRACYLDPALIERKPNSVGKAIPFAELLVLRPDGSQCQPYEVGELVQRGPLVSLGYWGAPDKTAFKFKVVPDLLEQGVKPERAVWSGDAFYFDNDGDLYFVGRNDDMLKCSGFRISPHEVESACYAVMPTLQDVVALAPKISAVDQAVLLIYSASTEIDFSLLLAGVKKILPSYAWPQQGVQLEALPTMSNGKIDRQLLKQAYKDFYWHDELSQS